MPGTASQTRRKPAERLLAWVFTGPLGHFYSVVADLFMFGMSSLLERGRRWLSR